MERKVKENYRQKHISEFLEVRKVKSSREEQEVNSGEDKSIGKPICCLHEVLEP